MTWSEFRSCLVCGGGRGWGGSDALTTCDKWQWSSGSWTHSHTLRQMRSEHVAWSTEDGVYLMGGVYSNKTTELLKQSWSIGGTVEDGFSLEYDTV